ncbi:hypothetical protein RDWZM_010436 [Blomia tropicalis]|uniref:Uncharacterized protein n=1 Tax=Blomia tropicalis TaxID=40697 RepID=A0A9Q0RK40_BLOTA|nr:hypothetical protein RDWZM_010436 [Blomia tropicalis]
MSLSSETFISYHNCGSSSTKRANSIISNNDINENHQILSWTPAGLNSSRGKEYFSKHFSLEQIPFIGSSGAEYWEQLFHRQYPKQDIGFDYCQSIEFRYKMLYQLLIDDRNRNALDIAHINYFSYDEHLNNKLFCNHCNQSILPDTFIVIIQQQENVDSSSSSLLFDDLIEPTSSSAIDDNNNANLKMIENNRFIINRVIYHPDCFRCTTCTEPLAYNIYCWFRGKPFCERHYLEKLRPRCHQCDEKKSSKTLTTATNDDDVDTFSTPSNKSPPAPIPVTPMNGSIPNGTRPFESNDDSKSNQTEMNRNWHMDHFVCHTCETPLAGSRYLVRDQNPHCVNCFEQHFANVCDECQKPIGINCKDLSYKERHWHEKCFVCSECKKTLLQQPFGSKMERIYCGNCFDQLFGTRCAKCSEVFRPGQRKLEYKGQQWHEHCFLCTKCMAPIGTKSFVPKNDEIYCSECYEVKFATRCVKCSEIIMANGVMFKDEPWHKECFTCNGCKIQLAGSSFLVRDERAYCRDCFADRYAHKCSACTKPILGTSQQSTRFINFEDSYWHADCFICVDCRTRLEGRGFIRDGPDIICGECAKIKLQAEIEATI